MRDYRHLPTYQCEMRLLALDTDYLEVCTQFIRMFDGDREHRGHIVKQKEVCRPT